MGGLLLIDTRSHQLADKKEIRSSSAETTAENIETAENITTAEKKELEGTIEGKSEIQIIRSSIQIPVQNVESCALPEKLDRIAKSLSENDAAVFGRRKLKEVVFYSDESSHSWMCELRDILLEEGEVFSVAIVDAPFSHFERLYPFLCVPLSEGGGSFGMYKVYPNEVEAGLYLGNRRQAMDEEIMLNHLDFTHVVDLHDADIPAAFTFQSQGIKYFTLAIWDNDQAVFGKAFEQIFEFVENARSVAEHTQQGRTKKTKILFHCNQGISRSASCIIYYMMRKHKISLLGAFTAVQNARDCASPNYAFARQLLLEEERLCGTQSDLTVLSYPKNLGTSPRGSCVI